MTGKNWFQLEKLIISLYNFRYKVYVYMYKHICKF